MAAPQKSQGGPTLLPGFDSGQEWRIRQALDGIKTSTGCEEAFVQATGSKPSDLINQSVIGAAFLLGNPDNNQMAGITEDARSKYSGIRGSSYTQAVTLHNWPGFANETLDARSRIFLNPSAFQGGNYSLQEVLTHELLHVAGWPPSGRFRSLFNRTDLSHYDKYDEIMAACN